jgi:glycosyltransferase involved in cell wall biosynthesis
MKCSMIIATYNRGARIAPTIDSVLAQTQVPDEIVVVDDGSTDNTAAWVVENYPMVRLVRKENGGTSSARNFGARSASGEVLIFLDHDDIMLPDGVATLIGLLDCFPEAHSAHCDHEYHNLETGVVHPNHHSTLPSFDRLKQIAKLRTDGAAILYGRALYSTLLKGNILQQPYAVRRKAFEALGGYSEDIRYCEDWDIYLRISAQYPVVVSDDVISQHIIEGENLHLTASEKQEVMYALVLQRRLACHGLKEWRESIAVRKKMASQEKVCGDRAKASGNVRLAWRCYWRSAQWWPQDYVTLVRLLTWSPLMSPLLTRAPSKQENNSPQ